MLPGSPKQVSPKQQEQITLVYLCTGSLDYARSQILIENTETLKIVTAVGLCEHIGIKKQNVSVSETIHSLVGSRVINP